MNDGLSRLAGRRRRLVAQAAAQRSVLAHNVQPWRTRLAVVDRGVSLLRYAGSHSAVMAGSALLIAVLRPRFAGRWLRRGWMLWQIGRRLSRSRP